ncbi:MAG: ATP-binding protein [Myxococcales bacterium]|nr:ATP-binding protein [Myxococcales bacterium]
MLSSLSMRLFALIAVVTLVGLSLLAWAVVRLHTANLEHETIEGALRLSDTLRRSARHSMLEDRKNDVYEMMRTVGMQPGIERLRILNSESLIVFSSIGDERGRTVDLEEEACTRCHKQGALISHPEEQELTRIFRAADGRRLLGLITPIYNAPSCAGVDCHASPDEQQVLGVIDMQLSLAGIDETLHRHNRRFLYHIFLLMLIIASTCGLFVWGFVHLPVKALIHGTERIRAGELSYRIPLQSRAEMRRLASSFNEMAEDLGEAQQELKEWTRTLEQRVEEKTRTLQQAQDHLVQREKMASLGTLAAVVAHEINNPLSGVLTYAKLLQKMMAGGGPAPERMESIRKYLKVIETETARCGDIVSNLLDFSRKTGTATEEADINEIVERTLFLIGHKLKLQEISLEKRFFPDLPPVTCDAEQIQQALLAVFMNAMDAMPDGGRLEVATRVGAESGEGERSIDIEITDSGGGIPPEIISRLFDPFFTTKKDKQSVGLGLSVVHGIVKSHHGKIDVQSKPGRTSFVITLPEHTDVREELFAAAAGGAGEKRS